MKRIMIAGSTGFIGRSLVTHFNRQGYEIFTISRRIDEKNIEKNFTPQEMLSIEQSRFAELELDGFVYAIGDPQMQGQSDGELELLQDIVSKLELVNFTGKFILISSNAANPTSGYASVNYGARLTNDYITRKQALESILLNSTLNHVVFRAPAVVGSGMNDHSHVMRLIKSNFLRQLFKLRLFAGTLEIITAGDLAREIESLLYVANNRKVVEPIVPCYTWTNLANFLNGNQELIAYNGSGITANQEKIAQLLPIDLRFLLFPHWVTKNINDSETISVRHKLTVESISNLQSHDDLLQGWHVVTGSSSGLGAETAQLLLSKGYKVIGVDIVASEQFDNYLSSDEGRFKFIKGDLSSEQFVTELLNDLQPLKIAGIFSIAGVGPRAEATKTSSESMRKTFEINFFLPVALYLFLNRRRDQKSYFVFVGSSSGILGLPRFSAYSATKSSLATHFFSVICEDLNSNVEILGIIPSGMKTNFQKNNGVPTSPLDKFLLSAPSKVSKKMVDWMETNRKKSLIIHLGISSLIFLVIRNLPFRIKSLIVTKLSEGSR